MCPSNVDPSMKPKRLKDEKPPIELIEEAFALLRRASVSAWIAYCVGTLPFVLAFLYFWSDMARSAFAHERLSTGVVVLSALFLWMKGCHAIFTRHLVNDLCGEPAPRWTFNALARTFAHQAILQPLGLFILPLSLVLFLPAPWTYAFFSNATVFAADPENDLRAVWRKSWQQAKLWPSQNVSVLFLFKLFGFFVFFNILSALLGVPFLLKTLLGIETVFTLSPWAALNSTMLAGTAAVTFLCIDPMLKATYALRTFYGESLHTGQDLKAELRTCTTPARAATVALLVAVIWQLSGAFHLNAAETEPPRPSPTESKPAIAVKDLDRSIDDVIQQREYSWRLPREGDADSAKNQGFLQAFFKQIEKAMHGMGNLMKEFFDWIRSLGGNTKSPSLDGLNFSNAVRGIVILLLVALAGLIIWLIFRLWKRLDHSQPIDAEPAPAAPNLADESVGAEQLPEDGWIRLGQDLLKRGELRLALRAFYLASLAHLAERQFITLAKFKSNLDYQRELQRRAHALATIPELFARNVETFERSWYGPHEVTLELLNDFAANTERLRTGA